MSSEDLISKNSDTNLVTPSTDDPNALIATKRSNGKSNDENIITGNSETIAEGISTMLAGVIRDFDSKAEDASRSQVMLFSSLDRLTAELDQLLEDAPLPFIMQHANKLSNVRKRVSSLNLLLRSVQHRLDNIDRMISVGSIDNKLNVGGSK